MKIKIACLLLIQCVVLPAFADLSVTTGPTPIPRGNAVGENDITVDNGLFAVAFAVDTASPWGHARGGIIDIALIRDGSLGFDIASLADFMSNNWSSWPTTYQEVSIEKETADEVVIKTLRDWGSVELETRFHIRNADNIIRIHTQMTNAGDDTLTDLLSGYVVWPDGGYLFGMPGTPKIEAVQEADGTADWSAAYAETWVLGIHAPFASHVVRKGRDRYLAHSLQPGEARSFEAGLQIEASGNLAPMVSSEIELNKLAFGEISGRVKTADGGSVATPAVVVYKDGQPYTWAIGEGGHYRMQLPVGSYTVYATAQGHSRSKTTAVLLEPGSALELDFDDLQPPGELTVRVMDEKSKQPLDARLSIEAGQKPLIEYFGREIFFTELDQVGEANLVIAPGKYTFAISAGDGFTAKSRRLEATVQPGKKETLSAALSVEMKPSARGWYSADLHHHSDVLDGFTPPEYVLRSELAAGVDVAFLSDHDSVVNNDGMRQLAARRNMHFIAGTELSPSWAHFNAYPLDDGKQIRIDTGTATVQQVFGEARRLGADVLSVNHPYNQYGYFENIKKPGLVPGGHDDGFDLVEIEPATDEEKIEHTRKTVERAWQLWNDGRQVYFAAGSDVHDVWNKISGSARSYVHVQGELTIEKFIDSLKNGRSYASQGPLIFPELMFGSEIQHAKGAELRLKYSVYAVNGMKSVQLIGQGEEVDRSDIQMNATSSSVEFTVYPGPENSWYSLVVVDSNDKRAYSNPIWVSIAE